jgi:hypothetical protein
MKKSFLTSMLLLFSICFTYAQFGVDNLKNKAKSAVGQAIDRKIEQEMNKAAERMVNKYWDKWLGKYYQENGSTTGGGGQAGGSFPFVINNNVALEESYSFQSSMAMLIESYKKSGKLDETVTMTMYNHSEGTYLGTKLIDLGQKGSEETFIINDFKNHAMVMLFTADGEKSSMAYSLIMAEAPEMDVVADQETPDEMVNFEQIGTKEILGYTCTGYRVDNEEAISEMWFSEEVLFGQGLMNTTPAASAATHPNMPSGTLMEWESTDKASGERSVMRVTELNPNATLSIDMNEYPRIQMGQ